MAKITSKTSGEGYKTYSDDGTTYTSSKDIAGGGYTTYGSDGSTFKSHETLSGDGVKTYSSDGTSYTTVKDIAGDSYTTYGSDGSAYKSQKTLFGNIRTEQTRQGRKNTKPVNMGKGIGGSALLVVIGILLVALCASVLSPVTYVYVVAFALLPVLSKIFQKYNISTLFSAGVLFEFLTFKIIDTFYYDIGVAAGSGRGGEGAIVTLVLAMLIIAGAFLAITSLGGRHSFIVFLVMFITIPWCFLNGLAYIPFTDVMTKVAVGIMAAVAVVDQISLMKES